MEEKELEIVDGLPTKELRCQYDPRFIAARKFALYELVTGEEYFTSEIPGKFEILESLVYLVESKLGNRKLNLGGYKAVIGTDGMITLPGLFAEVSSFKNHGAISYVKEYLMKDEQFKSLVDYLINTEGVTKNTEYSLVGYFSAFALIYMYKVDWGLSNEQALDLLLEKTPFKNRLSNELIFGASRGYL